MSSTHHTGQRAHRINGSEILAVALGGAAGAAGRGALALLYPDSGWAWTTLCINVLGCIVLAALNGYAARRRVPDLLRVGLGTGFCGAFTTFSTIMLLFTQLPPLQYAAYLGLTIGLCLAAVIATNQLASRRVRGGVGR